MNFAMSIKPKQLLFAICLVVASVSAQAQALRNEALHYDVVYHWGLIWKHAASATMSMNIGGNQCTAKLAARTISWADKIYSVRDTLVSVISRQNVLPLHYEKITHEDGFYGRDVIDFTHSTHGTVGKCRVHRRSSVRDTTLTSTAHAYDMLSVFYYLRTLNYTSIKSGDQYTIPVFSGKMQEQLNIRYVGIENVKLRDKSQHRAHHVKFKFSQDGKKKSSDDIDAWISTDSTHIPLMIRGKLPIGEMRVYYHL